MRGWGVAVLMALCCPCVGAYIRMCACICSRGCVCVGVVIAHFHFNVIFCVCTLWSLLFCAHAELGQPYLFLFGIKTL